jgi:hypothetical protein
MKLESDRFDLALARQSVFTLRDAAGLEIRCREGSVWITLDNDPRDIVLEAGATFHTPEHRRALVYGLEASSIAVAPYVEAVPVPARPQVRALARMPAGVMPAQVACA